MQTRSSRSLDEEIGGAGLRITRDHEKRSDAQYSGKAKIPKRVQESDVVN